MHRFTQYWFGHHYCHLQIQIPCLLRLILQTSEINRKTCATQMYVMLIYSQRTQHMINIHIKTNFILPDLQIISLKMHMNKNLQFYIWMGGWNAIRYILDPLKYQISDPLKKNIRYLTKFFSNIRYLTPIL